MAPSTTELKQYCLPKKILENEKALTLDVFQLLSFKANKFYIKIYSTHYKINLKDI